MQVGTLLSVVLGLEGLVLLSIWVFLFQLMKQQGRVLLRLDGLQRQITDNQIAMLAGSNSPGPVGLSQGATLDHFSLPDLTGKMIASDDLRGNRLLLVHWSPGCGFCAKIGPALAELQPALREHAVQLLLISYGDVESN